MTPPCVTVICTCYNHEQYVQDAIESVLNQTYPNIQLIVVDNLSTDNSANKINEIILKNNEILFLQNKTNLGICKAFNEAIKFAKGKYLIDLSADDILSPLRIRLQVDAFERLPPHYGLIYSNVEEIDSTGRHLRFSLTHKNAPSGNVFSSLLANHFLPSPSTIFRKDIFDELGGYNEELAFEDFDFWVRCSRLYHFYYLDIVSTKKRILSSSLSQQFYSSGSDKMLKSTWYTYRWAMHNCRSESELVAIKKGLSYYFRQSVLLGHFETARKFLELSPQNTGKINQLIRILYKCSINISVLYTLYLVLTKRKMA